MDIFSQQYEGDCPWVCKWANAGAVHRGLCLIVSSLPPILVHVQGHVSSITSRHPLDMRHRSLPRHSRLNLECRLCCQCCIASENTFGLPSFVWRLNTSSTTSSRCRRSSCAWYGLLLRSKLFPLNDFLLRHIPSLKFAARIIWS